MNTLENLSLKQLQYFAAVAEYGSFRQAAFRLNITQPTLSNQVGVMEKALNIQLLNAPEKASTPLLKAANFCSAHDVYLRKQGFTTQAALLSEAVWELIDLALPQLLGRICFPTS